MVKDDHLIFFYLLKFCTLLNYPYRMVHLQSKILLNLNIVVSNKEKSENNQEEVNESKTEKKVGRNEKCPCGSGKKFKYCHGNI